MKKSALTFALLLFPLLSFTGCYAKVEVSDSSAEKAIAIDWVEPPCAEPGSAAGYIEGNGFGAENVTVTVGGIEAEVLNATGKDASFVVPEGIPPGEEIEVVVMNPGGRLATIQWVVCGFDCSAIDCTSGNECVEDGTCDTATGMCIDGGNQPADTACGDGDVCDGQGNCVECNDVAQCTEDDNDCTAASCIDGACGQSDLLDGTMCDLLSVGDGVCMSGMCVAAPDCTDDVDCDDGNTCTADTCDPVAEMCVHTPVGDGAACDFGGLPGICAAGICEEDLCADVDCDDGNECTDDSCDPSDGTCSYVNTCQDTTPPVLTDFDFNPKQVDISTQSQQIACTMSASDSGTGVDSVGCGFLSPSTAQRQSCTSRSPISGDAFNGTWSCSITIPFGAETGTWTVDYVQAQDVFNARVYVVDELQTLGYPTELEVASSTLPDTTPPVLTDFDFNPKQVDISTQSQQIACTMSASDSGTGVDSVGCGFLSPSTAQRQSCTSRSPISGDAFNGTWSCSITIPFGAETGTWTVDYVQAQDVFNARVYVVDELQTLGYPTELEVASSTLPDTTPPVLTDFDFNPKQVDISTQSQQIACTMSASDSGTGVDSVGCGFLSPSTAQRQSCTSRSPISGDAFNGTWSCSITIPFGAETGTWTVDYVQAQDVFNARVYVVDELQTLGYPTELEVAYVP